MISQADRDAVALRRDAWEIIACALPTSERFEAHSTDVETVLARVADMLGALRLASRWLGTGDAFTDFEDIGDWYNRETGRLRPGKSEPMSGGSGDSEDERRLKFRAWADAKGIVVRDAIVKALPVAAVDPEVGS